MRWAETILTSWATPSSASTSAAARMVSQSDWLPMTMPIKGSGMRNFPRCDEGGDYSGAGRARKPALRR